MLVLVVGLEDSLDSTTFDLTAIGDYPGETNFVAVSYRWSSVAKKPRDTTKAL
jgi:hypothetical protein